MTKGLSVAATLCLVLLLAGCEGRPTNYYYLQPLSGPTAQAGEYRARIVVEEVALPGYLDRPDIVSQSQANELDVAEVDRWAEPLDEGVARVLRGDLEVLLAQDLILVVPPDFTDTEAEIFIRLSRFEVAQDQVALLEAQWRIIDTQDSEELTLRQALHRQPIRGEGYGATAAALNDTLHQLSQDIADAVRLLVDQGRI